MRDLTPFSQIEKFVVVVAISGIFGCGPKGNMSVEPLSRSTNLVVACQSLVAEGARLSKDTWMKGEVLPETISKLTPQYVQVLVTDEATVVDIQISGGFRHQGLLVVCSSKLPSFTPTKGRGWRIKKVGAGVFEYKE